MNFDDVARRVLREHAEELLDEARRMVPGGGRLPRTVVPDRDGVYVITSLGEGR